MFNWGILGLGRIAHKFGHELKQRNLGNVWAVGSRDIEKATDFANQYGAQHAYGSYDDFIENANVDAVYIAVPHPLHFDLAFKCISKGIPVLCEKPFTINQVELKSLIDHARQKKVFLMEAMWSRFMPHIVWLHEESLKGSFGALMHLKAEFCFKGKERGINQGVIRLIENELGGGSLLDIGIYPLFLSHLFLGKPEKIMANASIQNDIDETCQMLFSYPHSKSALLESSILWEADGRAEFYFENAQVIIPHKWHESNHLHIKWSNGEIEHKKWDYPSRGFYYEMKEVQDCIAAGLKESSLMPLDFSLDIMETMDKVRTIIGLKYAADK